MMENKAYYSSLQRKIKNSQRKREVLRYQWPWLTSCHCARVEVFRQVHERISLRLHSIGSIVNRSVEPITINTPRNTGIYMLCKFNTYSKPFQLADRPTTKYRIVWRQTGNASGHCTNIIRKTSLLRWVWHVALRRKSPVSTQDDVWISAGLGKLHCLCFLAKNKNNVTIRSQQVLNKRIKRSIGTPFCRHFT